MKCMKDMKGEEGQEFGFRIRMLFMSFVVKNSGPPIS